MVSNPWNDYTFADYVNLEKGQGDGGVKHEFIGGEIIAMAGGTDLHAALGAEIVGQLRAQVRAPCRVFSSDLWLGSVETGMTTYADASVVCGQPQKHPAEPNIVVNPTVICEVTSKSSERKDRGPKLAHYRAMASVQTVVIVSHREPLVEVHRRVASTWSVEAASSGSIAIADDMQLDVDRLYGAAEGL